MEVSTTSKLAIGAAGVLLGAELVGGALNCPSDVLRPPGAKDEKDFLSKCIKCGRCIEACPYGSLYAQSGAVGAGIGAPTLNVREQACRMCPTVACSKVCPTGALEPLDSPEDIRMGIAVINRDVCIAIKALRCEVCYRSCPLIDRAISIDHSMRENDDIHTVFEPIIDPDVCTGCGLCVERCPIHDPEVAVRIVRDRDEALRQTEEEREKQVSSAPTELWHAVP